MFNFTTTTILNSLDRCESSATSLQIKNVGTFKKGEITKAFRKNWSDKVLASSSVTVKGTITAGDIYRLVIDIELHKSDSSIYARPWPTKGKPVYVEAIAASTTASDLAALLVANADDYMNLVYDKEILTVSADGANVTVTCVDGAQNLKSVTLERWAEDKESYSGGKWVNVDIKPAPTSTDVLASEGKPEFGTYSHLIQNVVLPTYENIRLGSPAEVPSVDGKYTQFILTQRSSRDPYGTGAVGQELVSVTEHVFWVKDSGETFTNAEEFASYLTAMGITLSGDSAYPAKTSLLDV